MVGVAMRSLGSPVNLLALGAELLERAHRALVGRLEGILHRLAAEDLAEHVGQEVRRVERANMWLGSPWVWAAQIPAWIVDDLLPVTGDVLGVRALGNLRLV